MKSLYALLASSLIVSAAAAQPGPNLTAAAPEAATTVSVNTASIQYTIPYSGTPTWTRVYIDANQTTTSGYALSGMGADYLVENGVLYRYSGSNGSWADRKSVV